jgi:hypothetical protein
MDDDSGARAIAEQAERSGLSLLRSDEAGLREAPDLRHLQFAAENQMCSSPQTRATSSHCIGVGDARAGVTPASSLPRKVFLSPNASGDYWKLAMRPNLKISQTVC